MLHGLQLTPARRCLECYRSGYPSADWGGALSKISASPPPMLRLLSKIPASSLITWQADIKQQDTLISSFLHTEREKLPKILGQGGRGLLRETPWQSRRGEGGWETVRSTNENTNTLIITKKARVK